MNDVLLPSMFRIAECREAVLSRRRKVKKLSAERASMLQASLEWQRFCRDADEVGDYT